MRPKTTGARRFLVLVATLALAAACGGGSDNGGADTGGGNANLSDATVIMGTTDTAVHFDPGDAYDLHSWNVIYNVYDELMTIPPGGNQPVPSLAQSAPGTTQDLHLPASQGREVLGRLAAHVRGRRLLVPAQHRDQRRPGRVQPLLVARRLRQVDGGRDHDPRRHDRHVQPPPAGCDVALHPDDGRRGDRALRHLSREVAPARRPGHRQRPLQAREVPAGVQAVLERNDNYWGEPAKNARVLIQYYKDSPALKLAIQGGDVDIAFRNLTPTDIDSLRRERREHRRGPGHRDPLSRLQHEARPRQGQRPSGGRSPTPSTASRSSTTSTTAPSSRSTR